jgi:hypothetical protein
MPTSLRGGRKNVQSFLEPDKPSPLFLPQMNQPWARGGGGAAAGCAVGNVFGLIWLDLAAL